MGAAGKAIPGSSGVLGTGIGATGDLNYMGATIKENAGSPAVAHVRIREATSTGRILDEISLAASGGLNTWYAPQGKRCRGDLYVEIVGGGVEGTVFWA